MNSKTACKAKRETTNTRETHKAKSVGLRESRILARVLNLFCASVLELCSTEVELFASVESRYSVDFALQFGKAWNRIFVDREFYNIFVLIRDSGLCLSVKKSL